MRFLGSKFTQNALATGSYSAPPDPLPISGGRLIFAAGERERRGKREERKGKSGIGEGKEGGKGRGEGGKGKEEGKGAGVCVIGVRGIDAPVRTYRQPLKHVVLARKLLTPTPYVQSVIL